MRLIAMLLLCAVPGVAAAKDLRGRVGIGFNNQMGSLSALSVRYGLPTGDPVINVQLEGNVGFALSGGAGDTFAGGRVLYGIVAEDNMNLYLGAGAGSLSRGTAQLLRVEAAMGAQFFLFGLENLGFTTEWGLHVDTGDVSGASTAAAAGIGAHYWF